MPVDFSVKRVPDAVARRLRERALRHRRSLQQELLGILEAAAAASALPGSVTEPSRPACVPKLLQSPGRSSRRHGERLSLDELWERARKLGAALPGDSSTSLVRRDRDERSRR